MFLSPFECGSSKRRLSLHLLFLGIVVTAGCNQGDRPALGTVHGKVTLDGKPVADAGISFRPDGGFRESVGKTDAEGNYRLIYIRDILGAAVGMHKVRIILPRSLPLAVQEKYNSKSTLTRQVDAGDNEVDFVLASK